MNEKMEAALKASIEKWKERAEMHKEGIWPGYPYGTNCPLCIEARKQAAAIGQSQCTICPVFKKTGKTGCAGTPYIIYMNAYEAYRSKSLSAEQMAKLAIDEADFLESLKEP